MCKTTTTTYSCGCGCPPTKDWSPCEAFCKGETCTGPEEHAEEVEEPCKDCEAEAKLIAESLQKIAEDENLAPVPKTSAGAGENQSPKLYYTMVIRWPRCNRKPSLTPRFSTIPFFVANRSQNLIMPLIH